MYRIEAANNIPKSWALLDSTIHGRALNTREEEKEKSQAQVRRSTRDFDRVFKAIYVHSSSLLDACLFPSARIRDQSGKSTTLESTATCTTPRSDPRARDYVQPFIYIFFYHPLFISFSPQFSAYLAFSLSLSPNFFTLIPPQFLSLANFGRVKALCGQLWRDAREWLFLTKFMSATGNVRDSYKSERIIEYVYAQTLLHEFRFIYASLDR